jgi:hypothetical protein
LKGKDEGKIKKVLNLCFRLHPSALLLHFSSFILAFQLCTQGSPATRQPPTELR